MGKSVFGRFSVDFRSSDTPGFSPWPVTGRTSLHRLSLHYRERANLRPTAACVGRPALLPGYPSSNLEKIDDGVGGRASNWRRSNLGASAPEKIAPSKPCQFTWVS